MGDESDKPAPSMSHGPNARPQDERVGQTAGGLRSDAGNAFGAGSEEEERLIAAVIENAEPPKGANPEMPYDVDHARRHAEVKPRD
ncbi:hypothetical protein [Aurantimonas endophytica]|uniref:Uncharacterized protein n=1 Tax=Aurantimonas endophytica TaxID=1522175 RepID=A0A7W6H9Q6_9HYPH|nr:hypothetical protein [Aurantimonas endophytica]MBB4000958.1 hypothetical protein [Aurantimonas endophytica]MCO6403383.1 hypothetical protein [Aurantimonas endophytica]